MRPGIFVSRTREKLGRTLEPCMYIYIYIYIYTSIYIYIYIYIYYIYGPTSTLF